MAPTPDKESYVNGIKIVPTNDSFDGLDSEFVLDDNVEKFILKGDYVITKFENTNTIPWDDKEWNYEMFHAKLPFKIGNVLYNKSIPDVEDLIKSIIYYSVYGPPVLIEKPNRIQMRDGTICPTKEIIYENEDKKNFILYGRYIFGYDVQFVEFKPTSKSHTKIILKAIREEERTNEYNYSFVIVNKETNILVCFGLYC